MFSRFKMLIVIIMAALFAQCGEGIEEKNDKRVLAKMKADILEMVAAQQCNGTDDCRYIAFGAKPCGGPWEFLIYSISTTDSALLAERVRAYNDYENMMNYKYGYGSDCAVPNCPGPGCVDGACVDTNTLGGL